MGIRFLAKINDRKICRFIIFHYNNNDNCRIWRYFAGHKIRKNLLHFFHYNSMLYFWIVEKKKKKKNYENFILVY
jgi:hypothetical protein